MFTCCLAMDGSITAFIKSARLSCSTITKRPSLNHWNRPCIHVTSNIPINGPFVPCVLASPVTARRARSTEAFTSIYSPRDEEKSCRSSPAEAMDLLWINDAAQKCALVSSLHFRKWRDQGLRREDESRFGKCTARNRPLLDIPAAQAGGRLGQCRIFQPIHASAFRGRSELLGPAHSSHQSIRERGQGAYSHSGQQLYFSTSNNSDPNKNGRRYSAIVLE